MAAKTSSSTMSLKTLRGVFEEPKMNHRRDFLKENKLNLRELQKSTTQKLTHQKQEQEKKQYKHIEKFQKSRELSLVSRSASQSRNVEPTGGGEGGGFVRQSRITAGANEAMKTKSNCMPHRRAVSQQRQPKNSVQPTSTCCCSHQHQQRQQTQCDLQYREQVPHSARSVSVSSKTESCDKEIQTEDINDEDFLYAALKKCSSSEARKQKSIDHFNVRDKNIQQTNPNYDLQQHYETESKFSYSNNQMYSNHTHSESENADNGPLEQYTTRSQNSHITNGHIQNCNRERITEHEKYMTENLENQFQDLNVDRQSKPDVDQQSLSARSQQTQCSTSTKRRAKLGCREDLNLPRYLEKEKREKEEELLREMSKDPNCPSGHYALSEEERLKALHAAQQKMTSLINELNHLPMTTQTLRVRNRKADIEKELTQIEMDIRLYSKPKVYVVESLPLPQN